jgi:hypothetical protein
LIHIQNNTYSIIIANNTFHLNNAIRGLVYLDLPHREKPVLIYNNIFSKNIGYYGPIGIQIRSEINPVN